MAKSTKKEWTPPKEDSKNERDNFGRPTVMTNPVLEKLEWAFLLGCSDKEACLWANIAPATLYNYQTKFPGYRS